MNKKIIVVIVGTVLLLLGVTVFVVATQNKRRPSSPVTSQATSPFIPQEESTLEASRNLTPFEPVANTLKDVKLTADYEIQFEDLYGVPVTTRSTVTVNDNSYKTTYRLSLEGLTPPSGDGVYHVWLQGSEGVRTPLGDLVVDEGGLGRLEIEGPRPQPDWLLSISYASGSDETFVYRGKLVLKN